MSGSNTAISRRRLLQGAGAMWLLSVSQVSLAAVSQVVAVRVWPASSYTRVTVESNRQLKYKQFALSNPERVVVDIEDVNLNSVLKGMAAQIRADDPFIKSARVGQFDPQTVRMVFELKQNVKPQLFALAPVAGFKERYDYVHLMGDTYEMSGSKEIVFIRRSQGDGVITIDAEVTLETGLVSWVEYKYLNGDFEETRYHFYISIP